jgi:C_GCAxxG_C_C family probable redox protein
MAELAVKAVELHKKGYNCAQAVALSFCDEMGLDAAIVKRATEGFGAGMGDRTNVCGAVSGAVAAVGYHFSNGVPERGPQRNMVYGKIAEVTKAFDAIYGGNICADILQANPCGQKVYDAAAIVEKILAENK